MSLESLAAILALVAIVAGVFAFFDWLTKRDPAVDESVYDAFALKAKGERGREPTELDADYIPPATKHARDSLGDLGSGRVP